MAGLDLSALDDNPIADLTPQKQILTAPTAPLSQFEEDPENPRTELDTPETFKLFCDDIAERGILQPVIVREMPNGKLRLRFGHRRFRAATFLNLPNIPYNVTEDPRQFDDYAQVSENEQRASLQPLELAMFIKKRLDKGDTKRMIADKLHIDPSAITHLLALVDAPQFLLDLYLSRKCRAPHYLYELRNLHKKNAEIVERLCMDVEEIDKRFLVFVAETIAPPKVKAPEPSMNIASVMDAKPSAEPSGSNSTESENPLEPQTPAASGAPKIEQIPFHNPDIEKPSGEKQSDPSKLKKPLLLGEYENRAVMIVLTQKPTSAGLVVIAYEDGSGEAEVNIADVRLTLLTDSTKN
jgi:ParB family transcriptional regulator, chromosome partitioning protein